MRLCSRNSTFDLLDGPSPQRCVGVELSTRQFTGEFPPVAALE